MHCLFFQRLPAWIILFSLPAVSQAATPLSPRVERFTQVEVESSATGNGWTLRTTGSDPQAYFDADSPIGSGETILAFEYFCPDGVDSVQVFYKEPGQRGFGQGRSIESTGMPKAETWQPFTIDLQTLSGGKWTPESSSFRIDFGGKSGVEIQIRDVRMREPNERERASAEELERIREEKLAEADAIRDYLDPAPDAPAIIRATADDETITLQVDPRTLSPDAAYCILEYQPHELPWKPGGGSRVNKDPVAGDGVVRIPRHDGKRDRIASRWAVGVETADGAHRASPAVWLTETDGIAERDMPRLRPANLKGLAGISYKEGVFNEDVEALGITAATVNIELGGLLYSGNGKSIDYIHQGTSHSFQAGKVRSLDRLIRKLTERDIVVSAILLIRDGAAPLVHPDYQPAGAYAMLDVTNRKSVDAFRAIVSFLAERYSRPDREFGWITHWIVFNEVDFGWVWTNMGEQPMGVYMDAYHRALRLVYLETRRFNPTAEVFISLTHHWDYEPDDSFRAYAPRALLERMADYSRIAGDFHWGVAYHPYPQSLLKPRTWEDSKPTPRFDTPYITPKNIEVLDAYLHEPRFLYHGEARTVLLSEQGFHTPDYSEQSMRDKAAAIAYTWHKLRPLETIESFHYHRWIDHPDEGNLKVGLRTLPSDGKPHGERKEPPFSVFSAMETDGESAATEPLKSVLGIEDWEEVRIPSSQIQTR